MKRGYAAAIVGLIAVLGTSFAQDTKYTLRRAFKTNEIQKVKMSVEMSGEMNMGNAEQGMPIEFDIQSVLRNKIAGIDPAGVATMITNVESFSMSMNGMDMGPEMMGQDDPTKTVITTYLDNRMKPHRTELTNTGGGMSPMMGSQMNPASMMPMLPEDPVAVGESWEGEMPNPFAAQFPGAPGTSRPVKTTNTLVGIGEHGGKPVYLVKQVVNSEIKLDENALKSMAPEGAPDTPFMGNMAMKMKGDILHYLDKATGRIVKSEGKTEIHMDITGAPNEEGSTEAVTAMSMAMTASLKMTETEFALPASAIKAPTKPAVKAPTKPAPKKPAAKPAPKKPATTTKKK